MPNYETNWFDVSNATPFNRVVPTTAGVLGLVGLPETTFPGLTTVTAVLELALTAPARKVC
jgi:hypothetical protein